MRLSLLLSIAAVVAATAASPAFAMTCTEQKGICLRVGATEAQCQGAWKKCMKTGIYIGPVSGTNHGKTEQR
jgi:hypothetical protein